jgi:pimeloyl-ACP methyl ester carboxylesterase
VLSVDPAMAGDVWRDRVGVVLHESEPEPALSVRECLELYAGFSRSPTDIDDTIRPAATHLQRRPSMTTTDVQAVERSVSYHAGSIHAVDYPGEEPAIVLLHGFPDDHRSYTKLLPLLSPRRAVAFDFLGYGRSDRSETAGFSVEEHGAQITALLDQLNIPRALLVGHDASGPDAVIFAVAHPNRVAGVVLLNTIFGHQPSLRMPEMTRLFADPQLTTLADDMVNDPAQLLWLLQRWSIQWKMDADDSEGVRNSILAQFYGDANQPAALASIRAWCALLHDSLNEQDALIDTGALHGMKVPVSIIFGRDDPYLNPSLAAEIAALFENPSLHIIDDARHRPQYDRPDVLADLLTQPYRTT